MLEDFQCHDYVARLNKEKKMSHSPKTIYIKILVGDDVLDIRRNIFFKLTVYY